MSLRAQELVRVALCWKRIGVSRSDTNQIALVNVFTADWKFEGLTLGWAANQLTRGLEARSDLSNQELVNVWNVSLHDNLETLLAASVVQLYEEQVLTSNSSWAGPACNRNQVIDIWLKVLVQSSYSDTVAVSKEGHWLFLYGSVALKRVLDVS